MNKQKQIAWPVLGLLLISVSGCAIKPENVQPSYVSEMSYQPFTCEQLGQEQDRLARALATASDVQRHTRSSDVVGIIFLALPISSMSGGNQAANIARLKGELEAVQKTGVMKNCNLPPPPVIAPVREKDRTERKPGRGTEN